MNYFEDAFNKKKNYPNNFKIIWGILPLINIDVELKSKNIDFKNFIGDSLIFAHNATFDL